jgi:choice-of-anchor A domain-containing protein
MGDPVRRPEFRQFMRKRFNTALATAALAAAILSPIAARADTAKDYNLFVLGDMTVHSSDTEGRVAVKGNASLNAYSVGSTASSGTTNLVVGGNLVAHGGSTKGSTIVGGTTDYQNWSTAGLQPHGTALPVDFAAETTRLDWLTTYLAGLTPTGAAAIPYAGQYSLTGAVSGLNIFDISGATLANNNTFTINLTQPGSTILINVDGTADSFSNAGITINGGTASNVLWNFSNATTLSFSGINLLGSVLAPYADYQGGWGQLNGELIVKSFSDARGATQINNENPFSGNLLGLQAPNGLQTILVASVPEPATWAMMIAGFGMIGAVLRRRRALGQVA